MQDFRNSTPAPAPLRNRVTPCGDIVAVRARGTLMGNRGGLHREDGTLRPRLWTTKAWITCRIAFKERRREIMAPGRYTELFFLDEATAYAAGHRPCAECRRADYVAFRDLWRDVVGPVTRASQMDAALHDARVVPSGARLTWRAKTASLPDGTFIRTEGMAWLLRGDHALPWSPHGYGEARSRPAGTVEVLTPEPIVQLFAAGLRPAIHPGAA